MSIHKHVEFLVDFMERHQTEFKLLELECDLDMWCFISFEKSHHGFDLGHDLMRRLCQFPVPLIFDLYSSTD